MPGPRFVIALVAAALTVPATASAITLPPANAPFDYQLGGAHSPAPEVEMVVRDRGAAPAEGRYGVCYVNAFQTQPDELGWWRHQHPGLLARRHGGLVADPGWPGEMLFATGSRRRRAALARIVGTWIRGCAAAGYQGVELDNLDSWTRSYGVLTRAGNLAFARRLTLEAHRAGLAVAQKNTAELLPVERRRIGFDFAIAEECQAYHECDAYTRAYGTLVYEIEYDDDGGVRGFAAACDARGEAIAIVYRDRALVPAGAPGHRFRTC